jgi:hypothetical protein
VHAVDGKDAAVAAHVECRRVVVVLLEVGMQNDPMISLPSLTMTRGSMNHDQPPLSFSCTSVAPT